MRNISFAMTKSQILDRSKDVTRRIGWRELEVGTLLQGIEKGQGLRKGEKARKLAVIRVTNVRLERLDRITSDLDYGRAEVIREGFPEMSPAEFVAMVASANNCKAVNRVTRIEFEYVEDATD